MSDKDVQGSVVICESADRHTGPICAALNAREIDGLRNIVRQIENELTELRSSDVSPVRRVAAELLRRARQLPIGPDRNELRQITIGLLWLDKRGLAQQAFRRILHLRDHDAAPYKE